MIIQDVSKRAFSMPLTSPSYPRGPYRPCVKLSLPSIWWRI